MWLLYLLLLSFLFLSIVNRKARFTFWFGIIIYGLIFAYIYNDADNYLYKIQYYAASRLELSTEPLWDIIQWGFNFFNIPYTTFRMIIFLIGIILMFSTISEITEDRNVILAIYFIYPFMIDVTQIRNYLAMSVLIFSLKFFCSYEKKDNLKYGIGVFCATLIHNLFVVYFLLFFVKYIGYKKLLRIILALILILLLNIERIPQLVLMVIPNFRGKGGYGSHFFRTGIVSVPMILTLLLIFSLIVLESVIVQKIYQSNNLHKLYEANKIDFIIISKCIVFMALSFVLTLYALDFSRILRNLLIIHYAIVWEISKYSKNRFWLIFINTITVILNCYVFVYYSHMDDLFVPFFRYNSFFERF